MNRSGFKSENRDQFLGYEAGQFDGASSAFDTIANWIEEDMELGIFDAKRYIETLRKRAQEPCVMVRAHDGDCQCRECHPLTAKCPRCGKSKLANKFEICCM